MCIFNMPYWNDEQSFKKKKGENSSVFSLFSMLFLLKSATENLHSIATKPMPVICISKSMKNNFPKHRIGIAESPIATKKR